MSDQYVSSKKRLILALSFNETILIWFVSFVFSHAHRSTTPHTNTMIVDYAHRYWSRKS